MTRVTIVEERPLSSRRLSGKRMDEGIVRHRMLHVEVRKKRPKVKKSTNPERRSEQWKKPGNLGRNEKIKSGRCSGETRGLY